MDDLLNFEQVKSREESFFHQNPEDVQVTVGINERDMLAAMNDPRAIDRSSLIKLQKQDSMFQEKQQREFWSNMAQALPEVQDPQKTQKPQLKPQIPRNKTMLQKMGHDIKNFKNLPQPTTLKKVEACFMADNRVYVTISVIVAFLVILVIVILVCLGRK